MTELPLLVFDVNETLLDLDSLAPDFQRIFGERRVLREWFAQLILYSEALTLAGEYTPFGELGGAILRMIGTIRGVPVAGSDVQKLKENMSTMPPHADVLASLQKLRGAGFRLFALTNNPSATCERQLQNAGIRRFFEHLFSVDDFVRRYKPALEAYGTVQESLGVPAGQLCLVACHTWDILGGSAAGWRTALLLRSGNATLGIGGQPNFVAPDLNILTDKLLRHFVVQ